ncbi:MAG TPA: DUF222 domain-containing protein, partial [Streptosporangiaceae bacterium]|nr:DUF222 domain-containing protein [Streptosporangiaceae bacterium]
MTDGAGAFPGEPAANRASRADAGPDVTADAVALAQELPREGLSWTWDLDVEALLAALQEPAPWSRPTRSTVKPPNPASADLANAAAAPAGPDPVEVGPAGAEPAEVDPAEVDPVEAEFAEILSAIEGGQSRVVPLTAVAGRVAESLPTGPDLAGWLATGTEGGLEDGALAGVAASYRRLASWAQAGELAVVAELASRSASADERIGTDEEGRPARLPDEACAQVSLALTMSHSSATWWSDLAVTLKWRLPATGAALRSGAIDLARARAIAEATAVLDDEKARAVESRVLPAAGNQTMAQLRAALRRAIITADPQGAERRRQQAERRAKVMLYPEAEGTASLMGYSLPGVPAAAAMARIGALARALKASGVGGGIDLLRAEVFLGLLLGTLPYIPPPADGPPDTEPPSDGPPEPAPTADAAGSPAPAPPAGADGSLEREPEPEPEPAPSADAAGSPAPAPAPPAGADGSLEPEPEPEPLADAAGSPVPAPPGSPGNSSSRRGPDGRSDSEPSVGRSSSEASRLNGGSGLDGGSGLKGGGSGLGGGSGSGLGGGSGSGLGGGSGRGGSGLGEPYEGGLDDDDLGWVRGKYDVTGGGDEDGSDDDDMPWARPPPTWPEVPVFLLPGPAAMGDLRPAQGGTLDLRLSWGTLVGESAEPGYLGRLGAITPTQARQLAEIAASDPAVDWRVVVTGSDGRALSVGRVPRKSARSGPAGLVKRVTVSIARDQLAQPTADLPQAFIRVLSAAERAISRVGERALSEVETEAGCAHVESTPAYRPSPWLRDYVTARDQTCRFLTCRQPAWRCDLDHTKPYDQGGRTCDCNLG